MSERMAEIADELEAELKLSQQRIETLQILLGTSQDALKLAIGTAEALQAQLAAMLEDHPYPDQGHYRHTKTGGTYQKIGDAKMQKYNTVADMDPLVIYRSDKDGSLWVRPTLEFEERFTPLDG